MYEKEDFKNYLRINFDEDDKTIESFWHGAEEYICTRVSIKATPKLLSKYEMFPVAVKLLATQWYQTKMPIPQSTSVKANTNEIPFGVNALINAFTPNGISLVLAFTDVLCGIGIFV